MAETSKILDYRDPEWVGKRLGLDKNTVYKFLQDGVIPAVHLGRKWLISEARLVEWLGKEAEDQTRARREATQSADRTVQLIDNFTTTARMAIKQAHSEARRYAHWLIQIRWPPAPCVRWPSTVRGFAKSSTKKPPRPKVRSRGGWAEMRRRSGPCGWRCAWLIAKTKAAKWRSGPIIC